MAFGAELKMPHALVVPAAGQGHVNPCMLLARSLAALGFEISFVYFSSEYGKKRRLESGLVHTEGRGDLSYQQAHPSRDTGSAIGGSGGGAGGTTITTKSLLISTEKIDKGLIHIHVVEDGFAPGDIGKLFFVTPAMQENLFNLILELRKQCRLPNCVIADSFAPWTVHVAERAHIPLINYWTSNAMAYVHALYIPLLFSQGIFPEKGSPTQWKRETPLMLHHIPGLPPFSSEMYPQSIRFGDPSSPRIALFYEIASCWKHAERMLIHTLSELEPDAFHALQVVGISGYAIGPLLHHTKKLDCIGWLNTQAESSVIYIAFGSQASISAESIQELALGLEACGNPFLWVIREDSCGGKGLPQVLPNGLLDRISAKGMIMNWAPQAEVLAHKAIGGFFTHCGWNSTLESLWEGVPMLCCPISAEQLFNSHYICNVWGVGLELGRTGTGSIERRNVEVGVKGLMQEEQGLQARGKAQEVMELARKTCQHGGQSFNNLQKFYEDMKQLCYSLPS